MGRYGEIWGDMGRYAELLERSEADAGDDWHLEAVGSEKVPRRLRDGSRLSGSTAGQRGPGRRTRAAAESRGRRAPTPGPSLGSVPARVPAAGSAAGDARRDEGGPDRLGCLEHVREGDRAQAERDDAADVRARQQDA